MKKLKIGSILILLVMTNLHSQIANYGAVKMKEDFILISGETFKFNGDSITPLAALLKAYLPDEFKNNPDFVETQVLGKYKDNPFFGAEMTEFLDVMGLSAERSIPKTHTLASLSGLAIPNEILLGVTDWIVQRTKQELSIYFFENFKRQIQKYPDLRTVFPQTFGSLEVLGEEIYNYQRYLKVLQAAFQNDVRSLTDNLPSIIQNHPAFFGKHPELAATLNSGFYISNALQDKVHPGDIIQDYPTDLLEPLKPNWKGVIQTLQLISGSMRDTASITRQDSIYWIPIRKARALVTDKLAFKFYLGLIYQQAKVEYDSIQFETVTGPETLLGIFQKMAPNYESAYPAYSKFISGFSEKTHKLNLLIKDHPEIEDDSAAFQLYYDYYNAALDLFETATGISSLPFVREHLPNLQDSLRNFFDVARTTADLFLNVRQHEYSLAVINTVHIYDLVKANQAKKEVLMLNKKDVSVAEISSFDSAKRYLMRYGTFMAAISEAERPEDVKKVIESFALPQGSSRIKRQSLFNVSLNAYCGLFLGKEKIHDVDPGTAFLKMNSYGLTVPIGFSISKGYRFLPWPLGEIVGASPSNAGWSSSWSISLVDLGAVAAYRFKDDTAEQVPTVQLGDIFSPGIFWSLGIPKSPISFNIGLQVGPNLRKVNNVQNDYSNNTYTRYSASFCVDIPVLNLYTKSN